MLYPKLEIADRIARKTFWMYHRSYPEHLTVAERLQFVGGVEAHLGYFRKTRVPCSGECCGNPRRHGTSRKEKLTLQERRSDIDFEEQINLT